MASSASADLYDPQSRSWRPTGAFNVARAFHAAVCLAAGRAQAPASPEPPCLAGHAPKLTLRYHLVGPAPVKATFQRGAAGYTGNSATYFDGAAGYNSSPYLRVSADNYIKSLLRFDVTTIPITETVAEATLRVYPITRTNGNSLTLAAHQVLADWIDSQANRTQRQTGANWNVAGMAAGSDYAAEADGTATLTGVGSGWVEVDVTDMVRDWIANPAANHGLVLLAQAASGSVNYGVCSELGWSPCAAAQASSAGGATSPEIWVMARLWIG